MIRKIVHIGNPSLREVAGEVDRDAIQSGEIQSLIDDLIDTMRVLMAPVLLQLKLQFQKEFALLRSRKTLATPTSQIFH